MRKQARNVYTVSSRALGDGDSAPPEGSAGFVEIARFVYSQDAHLFANARAKEYPALRLEHRVEVIKGFPW